MYWDRRFKMNIIDSTGNVEKGSEGSRPQTFADGTGQTEHNALGTTVAYGTKAKNTEEMNKNHPVLFLSLQCSNLCGMDLF